MDFFPPLLPFEKDILLWVNGHHTAFLDSFMFMISNFPAWSPILLVIIFWLFHKKAWQEGLLILLFVGLLVFVGELISFNFAKPYFARFRPTHTDGLRQQLHIVFNYTGREYGFFSGHATNFFSIALFLSLIIRNHKFSLIIFSLVSLVCYSRMYLGVHYLSDILAGIVVGGTLAYLYYLLYLWLRQRLMPRSKSTREVFAQGLSLVLTALYSFLPVLSAFALAFAQIFKRI